MNYIVADGKLFLVYNVFSSPLPFYCLRVQIMFVYSWIPTLIYIRHCFNLNFSCLTNLPAKQLFENCFRYKLISSHFNSISFYGRSFFFYFVYFLFFFLFSFFYEESFLHFPPFIVAEFLSFLWLTLSFFFASVLFFFSFVLSFTSLSLVFFNVSVFFPVFFIFLPSKGNWTCSFHLYVFFSFSIFLSDQISRIVSWF